MISLARWKALPKSNALNSARTSSRICKTSHSLVLLGPFGFGIEIDDARFGLSGHLRSQIGLLSRSVTGIATLERLAVGLLEARHVFRIHLGLDLSQESVIHRIENPFQIQIPGLGLAHGNNSNGPAEMRSGFIEVKLCQRPVLLLPREPKI